MVSRVRSALKEARKGEVLRAIKRVQTAKFAEKNNTQPSGKQDVLVKELHVTKLVPLEMLACRIVARKLVRARLLPKAKVLEEQGGDEAIQRQYPLLRVPRANPESGDLITALRAQPHEALEERVYERCTSSKVAAAAANAGLEKLEAILNRPDQKSKPSTSEVENQVSSAKHSDPSGAPSKPESADAPGVGQDQTPSEDGSQSVSDTGDEAVAEGVVPEFGEEWDKLVGSGSEGESDSDDDDSLPESDYEGPVSDEEPGTGQQETASQGGDNRDDDSSGSSALEDSGSEGDELEGGLPSLAAGYVDQGVRLSGMGDASDYSDAEADLAADGGAPMRKNRMGQRARRALWEKKFGKSAKHVQAEKAAASRDRTIRGRGRGRGRGGAPTFSGRGKAARGEYALAGSNANSTPLGDRPTARPQPERKAQDRPEHPSWVAKQQQKKQAEAKPLGKKVVFD